MTVSREDKRTYTEVNITIVPKYSVIPLIPFAVARVLYFHYGVTERVTLHSDIFVGGFP